MTELETMALFAALAYISSQNIVPSRITGGGKSFSCNGHTADDKIDITFADWRVEVDGDRLANGAAGQKIWGKTDQGHRFECYPNSQGEIEKGKFTSGTPSSLEITVVSNSGSRVSVRLDSTTTSFSIS
jgi:hypothetical protein